MSALRYFRDDRGLTIAERGVTSMAIPRAERRPSGCSR